MKKNHAKKKLSGSVSSLAPSENSWWSRPRIVVPLFLAVVFFAYFPAWSGKAIWDDDAHLTKPELRSFGGLARIWIEPGATQQYYPLVHTVFWVEHRLFGDTTLPYHLLNISLHILGALLLWRVLLQLKVPGALLAAALFALHPLQVESVAWISELKNTLSGVFFFSALLSYLHFQQSRRRLLYALALLLFFLGLLCKSVIAPLPAVLLVIFWWQHGKLSLRRDLLPLVPFFILGLAAGLFTAWVEHRFIGAQGQTFNLDLIQRGLIAGRAFWFYLFKLLWPAPLIFIYPRWDINRALAWQYLFPLAALALFAFLFALRNRSRAPLAALLIFTGLLFPALGFINVYPFIYSFVADHFQYLASAAFFSLVAVGAVVLGNRFGTPQIVRYAVGLVWLAVLAALTWHQAGNYANAGILYRATIRENPECWMAENNLSAILVDENRLPEAMNHAAHALQLRPRYPEAHINLGNAFLKQEKPDEAIIHYRQALEIEPKLPRIYLNFGNALRLKGDFSGAIEKYEKAIELDPHNVSANNNLAWAMATCPDASLRDGPKAVELAKRAIALSRPDNVILLHTLAAAYAQNGQFPEAINTAGQALRMAESHRDAQLAAALQQEIALYQGGGTYTDKF